MTTYSGISQGAFDLIVAEEVSSQATYTARYQHPERPGGASGITIGIGYDCGYSTPERIHADWDGKIPSSMVNALIGIAGLTGDRAQARLASVRSLVTVPWQAAIDVFANTDIPRWAATVRKALPNCDKLSPDCFGALVSLAYNRGASFSTAGDRYAEMRAIKAHMAAQQFDKIPDDFRSMKRLWTSPSVRGVATRRDHEAALFQKGLSMPLNTAPASAPVTPVSNPAPQPKSVSPATKAAGTGTAVVVAGAGAAAASSGLSAPEILGIITGISLLAVGALVVGYRFMKGHWPWNSTGNQSQELLPLSRQNSAPSSELQSAASRDQLALASAGLSAASQATPSPKSSARSRPRKQSAKRSQRTRKPLKKSSSSKRTGAKKS